VEIYSYRTVTLIISKEFYRSLLRAPWTALDVRYIYTSPIPTFVSIASVTVAAAVRFQAEISTKVVKKVEINPIFYVHQTKKSSEALSRKGCPSDKAASTSPKGVRTLSFCRKHCDFCSVTWYVGEIFYADFWEDGPKDNLL